MHKPPRYIQYALLSLQETLSPQNIKRTGWWGNLDERTQKNFSLWLDTWVSFNLDTLVKACNEQDKDAVKTLKSLNK